ncbi:REP element-mobilizing transposase RayT [Ulvibacter sp. MAR_2010_11]|uniref:REP-associated tyrosine transposase n=1 Tax=Ulvibacter sp. MAR_2010_11 TaxID=1250229 RepID=UPI000C2B627B|nr:transposase [Ulvibacter sp. MAR_2010_11]PKA84433.1 REP element-mobilizing transposase RayT [Ulvibacter sp. MAR_2010_11]
MSHKYKVLDQTQPTFITITVVDWVDLFIRSKYAKILDDSLNYCIQNKGVRVHAYVYMTSHIHLIVTSKEEALQDIIRDFKKFTSKRIIETIKEYPESRRVWLLKKFSFAAKRIKRGVNYKFWKDGFHPVLLDTCIKVEQRVNYIHYNPVAARFVYHERDWINSSYASYEDGNMEKPGVLVTPLW